ncbi:hypothetical protein INS49_012001 [Diaporthe citri]|uniref:uncharacterized protein n=1 Tax=Diaporthe citri TaxID=83186 RepID=UPI001C7F562D|nr:uncharacterized protein INS49_012001 [Diaporthe citri]KAG6360933.1 hypothetical protein INS49_012001 [Diaporthe citri]
MANASASSASTTTTTPPSAWSRLVQLTRTASEGSRTKSTGSLRQPNQASSPSTHTSSVRPAKKRRVAESPPPRAATKYLAPLSPELNDVLNMSPPKSTGHISCPPISNHDCITACPCRVEDVDCVASQQRDDKTRRDLPRIGRQQSPTVGDFDQDATPQKQLTGSRPSPTQRIPSPALRRDTFEKTRPGTLPHSGEQPTPQITVHKIEAEKEPTSYVPCDLKSLEVDGLVGRTVSEARQPSTAPSMLAMAPGLQEGDQNSVNKTPISKRHSSSPASTDESTQLATPSSSPTTKADTRANDNQVDATKPHKVAAAPKTKRRLTLHGGSYERQTFHKKRKTQPKRKDGVQTTLSLAIGSSAGMRECKLCDTVYNPFHPEDVKVHAKRHAVVLKRERKAEEISGLTGSSLVE